MTDSQPAWPVPLRPELRSERPYGAPQLDVPILLNVNENPYQPSADVVSDIAAAVAAAATTLNRYPDRDFLALRADLAGYLRAESGVDLAAQNMWAANGSNEVMAHIFGAFGGPGRTALSFAPTYSMYAEYARDSHTDWMVGQRDGSFAIDPAVAARTITDVQPSIILLTSPNNPTGTALEPEVLRAVLAAAAKVRVDDAPAVVVVDEAYAEFRREGVPSALELLGDYPNLIVTRTMSKAFAAAGLRLGYAAADPRVVDCLQIVRLPYHLSAITQAAARAALRHQSELLSKVADLRAERDALVSWLRGRRLDGKPLTVADSDANFVYFGLFPDRHAVWQGLLDRGVLIREVGPDGWLRVSVGTPAETEAFKQALIEVAGI
ncbi:histidinol-phosphate transaminase [Rarobacter incanus]|uniref:Histidinol-phosphate aminotransferase n=1 Tax=Rarobacter incanus TaxID=153494 RepID=A0A542SLK0_9MICO|nr:histidinol-phosphate transaminase [Rarobacter incanus]TQK75510.1 histidinol phosphate aminotransferase [Rarobacter incanus]